MSTYGIDSFHISVGAGDAAIHVLIAIPAPPAKPKFECAILIDGGADDVAAASVILTMRQIETKYEMLLGSLKFDTIIITHWDTDHFGGILKMISDDIEAQITQAPTTPVTQISFMKYTGLAPDTVLYAPYWDEEEGRGRKRDKGSVALQFTIHKPVLDPDEPTVELIEFLDFDLASNAAPPVSATKICVLRYDNLLGVNFLTNAVIDPKKKFYGTAKELIALNKPEKPGMPGIYCVAARRDVLEQAEPMDIVDGPTKVETELGDDDAQPMDPNPDSICAMVIWVNGRLSHYFAGDVDIYREKRIALWTADEQVMSMKLSHHGALNSTPPAILTAFKSKNIIISSGNLHGHPRELHFFFFWFPPSLLWMNFSDGSVGCELMLYISAWLRTLDRKDRPVYTTEYPYYLAGAEGGKYKVVGTITPHFAKKVDPNVVRKGTPKPKKDKDGDGAEIMAALAAIYEANPTMVNLFTEFDDSKIDAIKEINEDRAKLNELKNEGDAKKKEAGREKDPVKKAALEEELKNIRNKEAKQRKIVKDNPSIKQVQFFILFRMVEQCWAAMSYIDKTCHRSFASGFCGASNAKVRGPVEYIRVGCRSTLATDGVVSVRYSDGADDEPPREVPEPKLAIQVNAAVITQINPNLGMALDFSNESSAMPIAPHLMSAPRHSILPILPDARTARSVVEPAMEAAFEGSDEDPDPEPELPEVPEVSKDEKPEPPRKVRLMPLITNNFVGEPDIEDTKEDEEDQPTTQPTPRTFKQSPNDDFYIYSTRIKHEDADNNTTLPVGDMNDFVSLLYYGVLSLEEKPTEDLPAKFLKTDEWFCWLMDAINVTSLAAIVDTLGNLTGFKLSMTPPAKSTSSIDMLFTTGKSTTEISGLLGEVDMMIFGLEHSQTPVTMTLPEAVAYVGLPKLAAAATVGKLGDMTLTLHEGGRNAIWFDPGNLYKTVVRLQFQPDLVKANEFFTEFLTDFKVNDAAVIVKRSSLRLTGPTGVSVVSDAEVILTTNCTVAMTGKTSVNFGTALTFHQSSMKLQLSTTTKDVFTDMMVWLARLADLPDFASWLKDVGLPQLRRISMTIELEGTKPKVIHFNIDMEVKMKFGGESAVSLVTYSWVKGGGIGALKGVLWCSESSISFGTQSTLPPSQCWFI